MPDVLTAGLATLEITAALLCLLHAIPHLGRPGRAVADRLIRAPGLDVVVALLTWVPWVAASVAWGWPGLGGCLAGQVVALYGWIIVHGLVHWKAARGPRLLRAHHRIIGPVRNQVALWLTAPVLPLFWAVRFAEILLYPVLRWTTRFPKYDQGDWVNVGRQKFQGLVGHDLVWCLYCDWMTGVYALGGEMLRNVESFWCPIRFYDGKKCANCRIDFPDVDAWVPADGTMAEAEAMLDAQYGGRERGWFGHPARLTVEGRAADDPAP